MTTTSLEEGATPRRRKQRAAATPEPVVAPPPAPASEPPDDPDLDNEELFDGDEEDVTSPETPVRPALTPTPPARPGFQQAVEASKQLNLRKAEQFLQSESDLDEMMEGLDFGQNQHEVKLARQRTNPPQPGGGKAVYLDSFSRKVTIGEIKDLYGGGEFLYTVWGVDAAGKRQCKQRKLLLIEGPSLINGKPVTAESVSQDNNSAFAKDIIKDVLAAKEREVLRAQEEMKELKNDLKQLLQKDNTAPMLSVLKETTEKQLEAQRELARLDAERRKEEREDAENRRKEEAAQRLRDEDRRQKEIDERRREDREAASNAALRIQEAANQTMLMMKGQTEVMVASLQASAKAKEDNANFMLTTLQQSAQQQMTMLTNNFQQQMQMASANMVTTLQNQASVSEQREKMLLDALKEAKSSSKGGLKEMIAEVVSLKQGLAVLDGAQEQSGGGVMDTIREGLQSPVFGQVVQSFLGRPAPTLPPGTPPGLQAPPMRMGVVQVSGPRPQQKQPSDWPTPTGAPPIPKPAQARARAKVPQAPTLIPPTAPGQAPVVVAPPPATPPPTGRDIEQLGVVFPPENAPDLQKLETMLRMLDVAVTNDWTPEEMVEHILNRTSPSIIKQLKETPFAMCLQVIETNAPQSVLNTAQGEQVMRKLFELMGVPV